MLIIQNAPHFATAEKESRQSGRPISRRQNQRSPGSGERNSPSSEHMVSTLAGGLLSFSHLLSEGQTRPFPPAILKVTEAKQDGNFCSAVIAVAQSSKRNLWELTSYKHYGFLRECVFLCICISVPLVQQLYSIRIWGPMTCKVTSLDYVLLVPPGLLPGTILFKEAYGEKKKKEEEKYSLSFSSPREHQVQSLISCQKLREYNNRSWQIGAEWILPDLKSTSFIFSDGQVLPV